MAGEKEGGGERGREGRRERKIDKYNHVRATCTKLKQGTYAFHIPLEKMEIHVHICM